MNKPSMACCSAQPTSILLLRERTTLPARSVNYRKMSIFTSQITPVVVVFTDSPPPKSPRQVSAWARKCSLTNFIAITPLNPQPNLNPSRHLEKSHGWAGKITLESEFPGAKRQQTSYARRDSYFAELTDFRGNGFGKVLPEWAKAIGLQFYDCFLEMLAAR